MLASIKSSLCELFRFRRDCDTAHVTPADTRCNNNVIITSRRHRFDVIMTLLLRRVSTGMPWNAYSVILVCSIYHSSQTVYILLSQKYAFMLYSLIANSFFAWSQLTNSVFPFSLLWYGSHQVPYFMMTSSNGNIFRVTGQFCGEFTGLRWIPHTKASDAELWYLICVWINGWINNSEAGDLRRCRAHYDVSIMWSYSLSISTNLILYHNVYPAAATYYLAGATYYLVAATCYLAVANYHLVAAAYYLAAASC